MKLRPEQLLPIKHASYYLSGEDADAVFETADQLLLEGDSGAIRLRVDVSELNRIEAEIRSQSLFGATICYAVVRNAEVAKPKEAEKLLQLIAELKSPHRLIICGAGMTWKKALHKKLQAIHELACCEFMIPNVASFQAWLTAAVQQAGVKVDVDVLPHIAEQLCGMRLAARQWIQRLLWYDAGEGQLLGQEVMTALLGERAPDDLDVWVHAVVMKDKHALVLGSHLLREQNFSVVHMHAWLSIRVQQLLIYHWFQAKRHPNPLQAAKVFGEARKTLVQEAQVWQGAELSRVMSALQKIESLLKGASVEDKMIVLERLVLQLLQGEYLA